MGCTDESHSSLGRGLNKIKWLIFTKYHVNSPNYGQQLADDYRYTTQNMGHGGPIKLLVHILVFA